MADGWSELGRVLGGGVNTDDAYSRGATRAAQLEGLIADAQMKRNKAQAQAQMAGALAKMGDDPNLATVFASGYDPRQLSGYRGDVQEQVFRGDAVARALAGDFTGANANLFGVASGPQALATVEGQNLIANRFAEGGGGVTTTEQGRAGAAADYARADSSRASAASSYASAARTRQAAGIDAARFGLERSGQWNPGGKPASASASSPSSTESLGSDWNPRQRTAVQGVQRNLLQYASALTGTPVEQLRGMNAEQIATLVQTKGGRIMQGGLARTLGRLPGGQLAGDVANADILSYSQGAGSAWAAFENPTGIITNTDRESATAQMPNYLDPPEVQARKVQTLLEMSGYQPEASAADVFSGAAPKPAAPRPSAAAPFSGAGPVAGAAVQRARNPSTGQTMVLVNGQWVPE